MKIYVAADHAGFELKGDLLDSLKCNGDYEIHDLGPTSNDRVDYPDFANMVCDQIKLSEDSLGILICGSGQGMAMRANKYKHVRAALCWNPEIAQLARSHNNANVLCLGSRVIDKTKIYGIVESFLSTEFEGGRHQNRVEKISLPIKE